MLPSMCVYQLAVKEERQEKAQLLLSVQEMNIRIIRSICIEKSMCLTTLM